MKRIFSIRLLFFIILLFLLIAVSIQFTTIQQLDIKVLDFMKSIRSNLGIKIYSTLTKLAENNIYIPITIILSLYCLIRKKMIAFVFLILNPILLKEGYRFLKWIFHRERPTEYFAVQAGNFSFPSGHATFVIGLYGFICFLIIYHQIIPFKYAKIIMLIYIIITFLVGLSRIYLGVHYLTDVLAGYCFGYIVIWFVIRSYLYFYNERNNFE
ncbi:MAG: phosphatase PAP2 family protein [Bacillaceae bacterium]